MTLSNFNYNGTVIQQREDGFVNLTQMCQANQKRLDHWQRLKQTDTYLQVLTNYLTCEVIENKRGADGGTWGHPSLAINLARWISPEFAVWCDNHIFHLMSNGFTSLSGDRDRLEQVLLPIAELKDIDSAGTILGRRFGRAYEQRYILQQIRKHHPHLFGELPLAEEMASLPTARALLTPTQIARQLNWNYKTGNPNPQAVNKKLEKLGYQEKIDKSWSATQKAIDNNLCDLAEIRFAGRKPVDTNSRTQRDQLLWDTRIVEILKEHVPIDR